MKRTFAIETTKYIGKEVRVCGWVNSRRDHGKIIFIDLRDKSGIVQVVFDEKTYKSAKDLRGEWVIEVVGEVQKRPKGMENPKIETGNIEIQAKTLKIVSEANLYHFQLKLMDMRFPKRKD